MAYTMQDSRDAFEAVRTALLKAGGSGVPVGTLVGDTDFEAAIPDEAERYEFLFARLGKEWVTTGVLTKAAKFTVSGDATGDGDISIRVGMGTFSFTPGAGDLATVVAGDIATGITSRWPQYNAITSGAEVLVWRGDRSEFEIDATSADSTTTVAVRQIDATPYEFVATGSIVANGRTIKFGGTAARVATP
jgi:hypothetical protein